MWQIDEMKAVALTPGDLAKVADKRDIATA